MGSPDRLTGVLRAVHGAPAARIVPALRHALAAHYAATRVELLLADYRTVVLLPVVETREETPTPVDGSSAGRAFTGQQPVTDTAGDGGVTVHLPVSVRGERLGVLTVGLPVAPDAAQLRELGDVAAGLAATVAIADRETDEYLRARRVNRLTLAAEMQWQLLPGRTCAGERFALAGQLEPAYSINGDNFDWAVGPEHVTVSVTNGMGEGIEASLLTNLAVNALRNARRAGVSLADQAALADQAVYAHHRGTRHVSTLLLRLDLRTGRMIAVDAGSPRVLLLRRGSVRVLEPEPQLPLGMFDGTVYVEQAFTLEPSDRLVVVSNGVFEARSPEGSAYGEQALARDLLAGRDLPVSEAVRRLVSGLLDFHEGGDLLDDAVVVGLDWTP